MPHVRLPTLALLAVLALLPGTARAEDEPVVVRRPKPAPAKDADLDGLAQRVLEAPDEHVEALARAVACLDLPAARAFVQALRERARAQAQAAGTEPRAWPPLGALGLLDDPAVDAAQRGAQPVIVNIESRLLEMPAGRLRAFLKDAAEPGVTSVHPLDEAAVAALLHLAETAEDVVQITAPRLSAYSGQRAMISVLNQVAYVQDYDVEEAEDGRRIVDPIIAVVNDGVVIEVKGTVSGDGQSITLELASTSSDLQRPIQEITVSLGASTATVQVPVVETHQLRTTVRLPSGHHVLVVDGAPRTRDGTSLHRVLLVRAEALEHE